MSTYPLTLTDTAGTECNRGIWSGTTAAPPTTRAGTVRTARPREACRHTSGACESHILYPARQASFYIPQGDGLFSGVVYAILAHKIHGELQLVCACHRVGEQAVNRELAVLIGQVLGLVLSAAAKSSARAVVRSSGFHKQSRPHRPAVIPAGDLDLHILNYPFAGSDRNGLQAPADYGLDIDRLFVCGETPLLREKPGGE
jgi:hypothetical protein